MLALLFHILGGSAPRELLNKYLHNEYKNEPALRKNCFSLLTIVFVFPLSVGTTGKLITGTCCDNAILNFYGLEVLRARILLCYITVVKRKENR